MRILSALALSFALGPLATAGATRVERLRCEYRDNPLGLDDPAPRLSWQLASAERGARQTAYRLLVASSPEKLAADSGDLWDSGRVAGDATIQIPYAGRPLVSRQQCHWKVCVWDQHGAPAWSEPATWSMGLLAPADWRADYIAFRNPGPIWTDRFNLHLPPARQYRREFSAAKPVRRATLYATSLGIHEFHLNGRRVGDAWFAPGWTDYRQRAYYETHDVTALVRSGANALGAWVGDGWYAGYLGFGLLERIGTEATGRSTYGKTPALLAQLEIEYADGTREMIVTDRSWKTTGDGPVREGDFLMGEYHDARREQPGWASPGFDDAAWEPAIPAAENGPVPATLIEFTNPAPGAKHARQGRPVDLGFRRPARLEAFPGAPVRVTQELKAVALTMPEPDVHLFNFGQNFAGVMRLKVTGPAGTVIRLRYGEMLHPDGRLMNENYRRARSIDHYVLRGDPAGEEWTPRFTFHGFQYAEVTGWPGTPGLGALTGLVLHSDTPLASAFECSDPMANRLFQNIVWTQRANFIDLPTDCPQRDERFGWTGDAQIYMHAATLNADVGAFYSKWLRELMESQRPSGAFPGYAPFPFQHGWDFGSAWSDAGIICPWTLWQAYGDTRIIARCWPAMTRFMDWRRSVARDFLGITHGNAWGDWLSLGEKTPFDYIDTVYFAYVARLMGEMAAAIGKPNEAAVYADLFASIKTAFGKKYLRADGTLAVDTQTAYATALFMDLVPAEQRVVVGQHLAAKLRAGEGTDASGMTTGFIGTRPLLPALTSVGQHDLAARIFQSRKFPSWGYEVAQGATSIWERWDSFTQEHGFQGRNGKQNAQMNSFSHYAFGAVGEWMINELAGIQRDGPGYRKIIIRPRPPAAGSNPEQEPIQWVKAHHDSIHGRIASAWRRHADRFELAVTVPANTSATVHVPATSADRLTENDRPLSEARGIRFLRLENGHAVLAVESGTYAFVSR
jgi:alpha-L-rhamnosidase